MVDLIVVVSVRYCFVGLVCVSAVSLMVLSPQFDRFVFVVVVVVRSLLSIFLPTLFLLLLFSVTVLLGLVCVTPFCSDCFLAAA